jgi:hypothetical protein
MRQVGSLSTKLKFGAKLRSLYLFQARFGGKLTENPCKKMLLSTVGGIVLSFPLVFPQLSTQLSTLFHPLIHTLQRGPH